HVQARSDAPCGAFPAVRRRLPGGALTTGFRFGSFRVRFFRHFPGGTLINRRTAFSILAVSGLVAAAAGCNKTTQPASNPVSTATLSFTATGQMDIYSCWELWADVDPFDGIPEDRNMLYCEQNRQENGSPVQALVPVPWNYSIVISVIRAG